jgi:3-dehydroquinate synthase
MREFPAADAAASGPAIAWQRFSVTHAFPVAFTRGLFDVANPLFADVLRLREPGRRHRCLVFVDGGLADAAPGLCDAVGAYAAAHGEFATLVRPPMRVPGGEAVKTDPAHLAAMRDAVHACRIDRHSYVVAIGGGALLDAAGLAAATAHRGVRHIRVPTTTLAQNDGGVGVKNAVNFRGLKNYLGTFAPPWAVLNDLDLLALLPRRERIAGVAEAVKVALIRDGAFFAWLEAAADRLAAFEPQAEERMIRRCAELHMRQIADGGDPFETGSARPLDFGHWSAHKLEFLTGHAVRHGEAVAVGLALDARYSVLAGLLAPGQDERVARLLERLGLPVWHPALAAPGPDGRPAILAGLDEFREHLGGDLTVTLLADIGAGVEVGAMDPALVAAATDWLAAREAA